ncbi:MAG TPA: clostripain-related cysteine peptidase [Polyangiaceae bacterium]|nr:clostripain-related cysteine peptidase [Polyangiaceae bacterium]
MKTAIQSLVGLALLVVACSAPTKDAEKGNEGGAAGSAADAGSGAGAGGTAGAPDGGETDGGTPDGGACQGATDVGTCEGDTVVFCKDGALTRVDCAQIGSTCGVVDGKADCTDTGRSASCGSLTVLGTCEGAVLKYCDESGLTAVPREIDCAAYGQKCDPTGATDGGAICVPQGPCPSGLTEAGKCTGNTLTFCEDSEQYTFDCGVDQCQTAGGFADCFVVGTTTGCGTETREGRCDGQVRVNCQGVAPPGNDLTTGVVAREDCAQLGLECRSDGVGFRCLPPTKCSVTCPSGTTCTGGRCAPTTPPDKDWTFMVYMIGNNNLSRAAWSDINEMETVGSTSSVNIVAEIEFSEQYSWNLSDNLLGTTFRLPVSYDGDPSSAPSFADSDQLGDVNMSDPTQLTQFIRWGVEHYPAKHYALVMWNHGAGYNEAFTDGGKVMSLKDLVTGIRDSGEHLDLLGFDACLMGMHEVAYAMRGVADFMVGSEEVEPGGGYPYGAVLQHLVDDPSLTGQALGTAIVDEYTTSYSGDYRPYSVTNAVLDLSKAEETQGYVSDLAGALRKDLPGKRAAARSLLDSSDLLRFTQKESTDVISILNTFGTFGSATGPAATAFSAYLGGTGMVVHSQAIGDVSDARGLALFLPQSGSGYFYSTGAIEGYKSRTSFLPMQAWTSFATAVKSDETPPTPGTGAVDHFSVVLEWGNAVNSDTSGADLDLYVFEPSGDFGTPAKGSVSGSGLLSPDSYESGVSKESYELAANHETGTYVVIARFYQGPSGEVAYPTLQVFRPDLPGGSRTLLRAKTVNRKLTQVPMDNSKPLNGKIDATNFQGVLRLDYSNLWYATTIEVK